MQNMIGYYTKMNHCNVGFVDEIWLVCYLFISLFGGEKLNDL